MNLGTNTRFAKVRVRWEWVNQILKKTHVVYVQIQTSLSVVAIVGLVSTEGIGLKEDESRIWFVKN
jgi:hypothetical protein